MPGRGHGYTGRGGHQGRERSPGPEQRGGGGRGGHNGGHGGRGGRDGYGGRGGGRGGGTSGRDSGSTGGSSASTNDTPTLNNLERGNSRIDRYMEMAITSTEDCFVVSYLFILVYLYL